MSEDNSAMVDLNVGFYGSNYGEAEIVDQNIEYYGKQRQCNKDIFRQIFVVEIRMKDIFNIYSFLNYWIRI